MSEDPGLTRILRLLETGKGDDDGEDEESTSRSSRRKDQADEMDTGPGAQVAGSRHVIDLEDLVFTQGSHFMANKRCQLPDGSFRKQRKGMSKLSYIRKIIFDLLWIFSYSVIRILNVLMYFFMLKQKQQNSCT
jgi:hypothetical protein